MHKLYYVSTVSIDGFFVLRPHHIALTPRQSATHLKSQFLDVLRKADSHLTMVTQAIACAQSMNLLYSGSTGQAAPPTFLSRAPVLSAKTGAYFFPPQEISHFFDKPN